ncbi:ATP-binding protein [Micromonospora wenchangensis]|uniref:ATP-binding protein n=1 Tax=Micromonospora wenchangensis TaxID=1185415 RepID=UPI003D731E13
MGSNDVDVALAESPADVGPALLALPEDQWFDRKSSRIAPKDLGPALVAFANAEGGTIIIGLHNGVVEGFSNSPKKLSDFRQAPFDFTSPPVRSKFFEVDCINAKGNSDKLLIVRVDPGERVHELMNGDCFLRVGDESRKLNFAQRQELEYDRGQSQYDALPVGKIPIKDLDKGLVSDFLASVGAKGSTEQVFRARSLLTSKGELTTAGYLLFGEHPQDEFPQAHVRVLRFLDVKRGTGARLGLEEGADVRIEGPIPRAINEAQELINSLMPRRRALGTSGKFEPRPIVPRDAWLEGLVNAVVHRSYSLSDHIRVEIYPNRIQIESPGRFPGLANPQEPLKISRFARNPRIARVCADLMIGQELGEGIRRIFEEMRRTGLTDPVYTQTQASVRLVLSDVPRIDPRTALRMPHGSQRVLNALRAAGTPLGTGEVVELLGLSRPYVLTRLRALESEGFVRWSGKSPRDPRAVWLISEE